MCFQRARAPRRRGHDQNGDDSRRRAFGDAGDQSSDRALCLSRGADCAAGEAFCGSELEGTDDSEEQVGGVQCGRRSREEIAALGKMRFPARNRKERSKTMSANQIEQDPRVSRRRFLEIAASITSMCAPRSAFWA